MGGALLSFHPLVFPRLICTNDLAQSRLFARLPKLIRQVFHEAN